MSVRPGTRLDGRYRLTDRLAYGGMGEVWRGMDDVLSRSVAVKILRAELAEDEAFRRRFRAEARTTGGLPHNGIAAVYDYGETTVGMAGQSPAPPEEAAGADPIAYLVMELVPGEALSTILSRDGALGTDRTLDVVAQAARALHAAHLRGVIHRDIKPANLMVTPEGRVKVTDFGIARPRDHEPLTATGQVMGTAHYLAPELAKGEDASTLSDVYALGVVAYECLAGHRPFEGDNQVAVALAHLNEQPPPLPGTIAPEVRSIVAAAMDKDPSRRMPSADAFGAALEALRHRAAVEAGIETPATGVLEGSAAAVGLAAAGLWGNGTASTNAVDHGRTTVASLGSAVAPAPVPDTLPPPNPRSSTETAVTYGIVGDRPPHTGGWATARHRRQDDDTAPDGVHPMGAGGGSNVRPKGRRWRMPPTPLLALGGLMVVAFAVALANADLWDIGGRAQPRPTPPAASTTPTGTPTTVRLPTASRGTAQTSRPRETRNVPPAVTTRPTSPSTSASESASTSPPASSPAATTPSSPPPSTEPPTSASPTPTTEPGTTPTPSEESGVGT
jgi:hypothetical protein